LALAQAATASLDLVASAGVLYVLLPAMPDFSFAGFIGYYLLAVLAGLVSQVPGGLGVFESVMMVALSSRLRADAVLGALLAYRGIYYLLPLVIGIALMLVQEVREHARRFQPVADILGRTANVLVPNALAFLTFLAGAMLLFSGSTPGLHHRLKFLDTLFPLSFLETSHLLGSLAGMGLLLLARGLQRRSDAAWHVTVLLVAAGIVFSLLKGLDYEEAALLTLLLVLLAPCRDRFYRKAALFSERFTLGWIVSIAIVLLTTVWLGLLAYKHVNYREELWWRFTLHGDAPRYLRATLGVLVVASCFAVARLMRPGAPPPEPPTSRQLDHVAAIVQQSPHTYAYLALLGDKSLLYDETRAAFIMYGIEGRSWIAMGDPVGPAALCPDLIWDFRELCDRHGGWAVFYQVSPTNLPLYLDLGLTPLKLGEEALVPLTDFSLEGGRRKGLRMGVHRMHKDGCTFEIAPPEAVAPLLPELRRISGSWLAGKNTREKRFSLGFFSEDYLCRCPVALARLNGRPVAFANLWVGAGRQELSVDLMRHDAEAPSGIMDYLFVQIFLWGRDQGYRFFNMGVAPLAGLENRALAPLWNRLGATIFRYGEHFYNFQGLRQFKQKFDPQWRPKYLVSPAGLVLPNILLNVAAIIAGGAQAILRK
jgi:phosphatidylglycerol lysyltransferase